MNSEVIQALESLVQLLLWVGTILLVLMGVFRGPNDMAVEPTHKNGTEESGQSPKSHPVLQYFPLYVGTCWTYSYGEDVEYSSESVENELDVVTECVAMVTTSLSDKVYTAKVAATGPNFLGRCSGGSAAEGGSEYWMVADASRLFIVCSRREAGSVEGELFDKPNDEFIMTSEGRMADFVFPLEKGKTWPAWPGPPDEDSPRYQWHVESKLDVQVPAGTFEDCYRIQLLTGPDTTKRWLCPGVGIVAMEYNHHGSTHDYRAELISYELAGRE